MQEIPPYQGMPFMHKTLRLPPPCVTSVEYGCFTGILHIPAQVLLDLSEHHQSNACWSRCVQGSDQGVMCPRNELSLPNL